MSAIVHEILVLDDSEEQRRLTVEWSGEDERPIQICVGMANGPRVASGNAFVWLELADARALVEHLERMIAIAEGRALAEREAVP